MLTGLIRALIAVILATLLLSLSIESGRARADGDNEMTTPPVTGQPAETEIAVTACVTRGEYDRLAQGMSLASVRALFDIPGQAGPTRVDEFAQDFKTCWAPGEKKVRVWFSIPFGLSTRWLIINA